MSFRSVGQEIVYEDEPIESTQGTTNQHKPDHSVVEGIEPFALNVAESFSMFQSAIHKERRDNSLPTGTSTVESPWEKYHRIKSELEELKTSLSDAELQNDEKNKTIWSLLKHETDTLLGNVESISTHTGWSNIRGSSSWLETSGDVQVLRELVEQMTPNQASDSKERLWKVLEQFISTVISKRVIALESKVSSLQAMVSPESDPTTRRDSSHSLSQQLNSLTQKVDYIEKISFDQLRMKIQGVKLELESILSPGSDLTSEASKFSELYGKVRAFLDNFSTVESSLQELPTLLLRLKTLEQMHRKAASFTNRMDQLEIDVQSILKDLQSNDSTLQELKDNLKENLLMLENKLTK